MEFTDISGVLTTTVSSDMVTDAEFDVLWEGNKTRFFTHGAWPGFSRDPNDRFYADNIDDAKVKFKEYLTSFLGGVVKTAYKKTWVAKVYEVSTGNIVGLWLYKTTMMSNDTFAWPIPTDLQKLWDDQGLTGDLRVGCVDNSDCLTLPLSDGTSTFNWFLSWYTHPETFTALHTAFKADGYTKVVQRPTGKTQKDAIAQFAEIMKLWDKDFTAGSAGFPAGPNVGESAEAAPIWDYVSDNITPAMSLGLCQFHNAYKGVPDAIKPCGWPLTTMKIGGNYPPYPA